MSFLLDTCLLSELTRPRPNEQVALWLQDTPEAEKFVSVISLGEIAFGIRAAPEADRRRKLEQWYSGALRPAFEGRVLAFDEAAADRWAWLRARKRDAPVLDAQLGATALVHDLTLVTRNVRDFDFEGLRLFNPWQDA